MTEKTNKFVQLPFDGGKSQSPLDTQASSDPKIFSETVLPDTEAFRLATLPQLVRIGAPWRVEIDNLTRAGFKERAETEPDQARDIEFKTKDGKTIVSNTTLTAINAEIEKRLREAAESRINEARKLEEDFDRADKQGSIPTNRISTRIGTLRKEAEYLKNGT